MKRSFFLWVIANLILSGALSVDSHAQAAAKPPSLEGTVSNQLTGAPIPLAEVRLAMPTTPAFGEATVTDAAGHFQFSDLSQGNYSLTAVRPEFLPGQPSAVSVGAEPASSSLLLAPLGVIAGTVFAEDGDPLSGATVEALSLAAEQGRTSLSAITQTTTDDLGSYRLHGLPPGRYYVRVTLHGHSAPLADDSPEPTGPPVFYPRAISQSRATALDIAEGSTRTDINLMVPGEYAAAVPGTQTLSAAEDATIQGQVLNAATGNPLSNTRVALQSGNTPQAAARSTRSDASGSFSFDGVSPGTYRFTATHTGFLESALSVAESSGPERSVTVSAGQKLNDVFLRLVPQGVIAGRVLDGGMGISNAMVMAAHSTFVAGQRKLILAGVAYTNDLGEYRLFGLPPGHYYVSVTGHNEAAPGAPQADDANSAQSNSPGEEYVDTFYPGALTIAAAAPLEVTPGSIQTSMDITPFRMRKWTMSGKVLLPPDIHFTRAPVIMLLPRDPSLAVRFSDRAETVDEQTGAFEIHDVPPGGYTLTVDAQVEDDQYIASLFVDISTANVDGLAIALNRAFPLDGHVTVEDSDQCSLSGLSMNARSTGEQGAIRNATVSVAENGSFQLANLVSDHYRFRLTGVSGNCYLKSISLGSSDVSSSDVQLGQGSPPIGFLLSDKGGKIDGDVMDSRQQPVRSAIVVLVPQPPLREHDELYRKTSTDQSGKFSLQGIPPGEYKVFAWDAMDSNSEPYLDPDVLAPFESLGQSVSVQEAGQSTVELNVILNDGRLTP